MNFKHSINAKNQIYISLLLLLAFVMLINNAFAATHEIGFGTSILNINGNQNSNFGFNLYYDYSPIGFLTIGSEISGHLFDNELTSSIRDTYFDEFYLNRESLSEKPQNSDFTYNFSYEESIIFKTIKGKFKLFVGIGIGYHILSNSANLFVSDESKIYALGYNIRGGLKYPIGPKLFTYIEAKFTYTNYYGVRLGGGALVVQQYYRNVIPNLNRLVILMEFTINL